MRVLLGFLTGATMATILGALTGYSQLWRQLLDPMLQGMRAIPSIAWVPLFILWLGIFETSKVTLIAVGVFFPVYLNLMAGIADVDRRLVEVGRIYQFSPLNRPSHPRAGHVAGLYHRTVWRPGAWLDVRRGRGNDGASEGLGFLLIDGQQTGRPAVIIASILLFAILGKLTDLALARLGRRALAWQDFLETKASCSRSAVSPSGLTASQRSHQVSFPSMPAKSLRSSGPAVPERVRSCVSSVASNLHRPARSGSTAEL